MRIKNETDVLHEKYRTVFNVMTGAVALFIYVPALAITQLLEWLWELCDKELYNMAERNVKIRNAKLKIERSKREYKYK